MKEITTTLPALHGQGGVSSFYNSILPHLSNQDINIKTLEIGSWGHERNIFKPLQDQFFFRKAFCNNQQLIHINPSLGSRSFWRDGLFAWQTKRKEIPLLVFFHGWDHDFARTIEKNFMFFFRNTFAKADSIIVLASEFKEKLQEWGVTAPIYIETTTVDETLLKSYTFSPKKIRPSQQVATRILFLSRLEKEKGVFETIKAFHILRKQGVHASLSIAGSGSAKTKAEQLVEKLQLTDDVSFLGYVHEEEKINVFKQHDLYCLPTYGEGLPTSVLEAMAFGLPVITTSVGGLKDIFQDKKMGFLLDDTSPQNIADKLQKLIKAPDHVQQISAYNYQYAQEHFMASRVAKRLVAIYEETILRSQ